MPLYYFVSILWDEKKKTLRRFRGLTIGDTADDGTTTASLLLTSLQVPKEFYLPEAAPTAREKEGTGKTVAGGAGDGEGGRGTAQKKNAEEAEGAGFLSFGTGAMEVDP